MCNLPYQAPTVSVPTRDGKSCGKSAKTVVMDIPQPTPSIAPSTIPITTNTGPDGKSIRNLHSKGSLCHSVHVTLN